MNVSDDELIEHPPSLVAAGSILPQFEYRSSLIQWLRKVFKEVEFCRVTLHLAVFLLNYFMDSHSIHPEKLTPAAKLCFTPAGNSFLQQSLEPHVGLVSRE